MEAQRRRAARRDRVYDAAAHQQWFKRYKLKRYGLTPETFSAMLESQGNACAMGREPFEDGQSVFIDHDHACCRMRNLPAESACAGCCVSGATQHWATSSGTEM
jgi:hypothetical protein